MPNQDGLRWTLGIFHQEPQWTREPEMKILEQIAHEVFGIDPATPVSVTFLAVGAFNKVYTVSGPSLSGEYILRVSLPVDPPYKSASEVATVETVRKLTDIPAPRVIASDSNNGNPLGFEWILMEKVLGEPLSRKWRKMSWGSKEKLVKKLARFDAQMFHTRYSGIGNLYTKPRRLIKVSQDSGYASAEGRDPAEPLRPSGRASQKACAMWQSITKWPAKIFGSLMKFFWSCVKVKALTNAHTSTSKHTADDVMPASNSTLSQPPSLFKLSHASKVSLWSPEPVGRLVSMFFFMGDHVKLDIDRGPYKTAHDWLKTQLQVTLKDQEDDIKTAKEEDEEDDLEDAEFSKVNVEKLMEILPQVFSPDADDPEPTVLLHHDLHARNIMVNEDGEITGILDWECVQTVPLWRACRIPKFLDERVRAEKPDKAHYGPDNEPFDETDPDQLDNEGVNALYWEHLKEYECTQLRKTYLAEMAKLSYEWADLHKSETAILKNDFVDAVQDCAHELRMTVVRNWADAYLQGQPKRLDFFYKAREASLGKGEA